MHEACDLYNCALEERIGAWKTCRRSLSFYDQDKQLKTLRAKGLVKIANYGCARDVLRRLDRSFTAFFTRVKKGQKPGFPRFKSFRRYDSLTFPAYGNGCGLKDKMLRIQGVGEIKVKLHRPMEGKIKTVCVKRAAGRWFVIFSVECDPKPLPASPQAVGIDLGLTALATLDTGEEIGNPRYFRQAEKKLRVAQRRVARRTNKRSNRRRKAMQLLQRQFVQIQNQRSDFHHKVSRSLVNRYGMIAVEDLNVNGLASGMLAKSIHDVAWESFLNQLAYKAESAGRELVRVNPRGTSQTCLCGAVVAKTLRDRWHSCPTCGLEGARDHVSAQIILRLGLSLRNLTRPTGANVLREAVAL